MNLDEKGEWKFIHSVEIGRICNQHWLREVDASDHMS